MYPNNQPHQPEQRVVYSYATDQSDSYFQRERFNHVHDVLERTILLVGGAVSSLLVARFVLSLLAANQTNGIVVFVDSITQPLVMPFYGLFNVESVAVGSFVFEGYTLIALIGYSALAGLLARVASITRY